MHSRTIRASVVIATLLPCLRGADLWWELRMGGQPAGYMHERSEALTAVGETRIVINRMGSRVEIEGSTRTDQNSDGTLRRFHSELKMSAQPTVMEGEVVGQAIALHISTGGKTYDRSIPLSGDLLGPEGARRLTLVRLRSTGDSVSYQIFVPELGAVSTVKRTLMSPGKVEEEVTGMPGKATVWLDRDGQMERQVQPGPFGEFEFVRAAKAVAMAATGASLPAESFSQTLVHSAVKLPNPRGIESLRIRIVHKKPELGWPELAGEYQTVIERSADSVVLEIRRPKVTAHGTRPSAGPLAANALFQSDDAEVQKIAATVVAGDTDAFRSALALRDWVKANMKFDYGSITVVPASEVARDRKGTCFAYAILLGSLARAAGIPSRLKMGLAYTDGVWGGHAWVEVQIDGAWIPLDAALPSPEVADAARFAFFTSSLDESALSGIGSLAQLFGNVDIQILSYR